MRFFVSDITRHAWHKTCYLDGRVAMAFFSRCRDRFLGSSGWQKAIAPGDPGTLHLDPLEHEVGMDDTL